MPPTIWSLAMHPLRAKYAHRYLAEVQYRFNRRFDLRSILPRLVRGAAVAKPHTRSFIREAEVGC